METRDSSTMQATEKSSLSVQSLFNNASPLCLPFYGSILEKSINHVLMEHDINIELISSAVKQFCIVLDNAVMYCLDNDMKEFLKNKQINLPRRVPDEYARKLFNQYMSEYRGDYFFGLFKGTSDFTLSIINKYPGLQQIIECLCNNFSKNLNRALERIKRDESMLIKNFLSDMNNPKLAKILSTGSDFHKQGQQVLILVYNDDDGREKKIVYKPSPVLSDAMIMGDTKRLRQIDESYDGQQSFVEMFNIGVEEQFQISTYLIVPRIDGDSGDINSHYGFIEFIEHNPSPDIDVESLAGENKYNRLLLNPAIEKKYQDFIQNVVESGQLCDCVLKSREELDQYSFCCGKLLAIMELIGLTDVNCENLIIRNGKPVLIDVEACFSLHSLPSARQTCCFSSENGSMNGKSRKVDMVTIIRDIRGREFILCELPALNQIVYVDDTQHTVTLHCNPNREALLAGYNSIFDTINKDRHAFLAWFDQAKVQEMKIRFLPKSTGDYAAILDILQTANFSYDRYKEYIELKLSSEAKFYYQNLLAFQTDQLRGVQEPEAYLQEIEFHLRQPPLHVFCTDMDDNLFDEYCALSVPYFYMNAMGMQLFDAKNKAVRIPAGIAMIRECMESRQDMHELDESMVVGRLTEPSNDDQFFSQPPLVLMRQRAEIISSDTQLQALMALELVHEMNGKLNPSSQSIISVQPTNLESSAFKQHI